MRIMLLLLLIAGTENVETRWPNGNVKEQGTRVDGKKEGVWKTWYESGQPHKTAEYKNGELHGTMKSYYPSGKLFELEEYKDGKLHGRRAEFYKNGRARFDWKFADGKPVARERKMYYDNGVLKMLIVRLDDKGDRHRQTSYHKNGRKQSEMELVKGWKVGTWTRWHSNGRVWIVVHYNDKHKEHGETRIWDRKGRLVRVEHWENGKQVR